MIKVEDVLHFGVKLDLWEVIFSRRFRNPDGIRHRVLGMYPFSNVL